MVSRESAIFGVSSNKENIVKLNATHSDMCRFDLSGKDQDVFKLVRGNIEDVYEKALKKGESLTPLTNSDEALERRFAALQSTV